MPDPTTVRLITDSNAMLPAELIDRFRIDVVPMTIVVDGDAIDEDDIALPWFYERLRAGAPVSTSAPAPGRLLAAYEAAASAGADAVLSIHVGSNQSATVAAAHLAARDAPIPVRVVDTGTASFIEGCCVWRAAERLTAGSGLEEAAAAAAATAEVVASVFTIGEISRAQASGRLDVSEGEGVPVFTSLGPEMHEVARATTVADAVDQMVSVLASHGSVLRVGIGHADATEAGDALEAAVRALPEVSELVRYKVGPSVAAHTGAGTFGAVYHPI